MLVLLKVGCLLGTRPICEILQGSRKYHLFYTKYLRVAGPYNSSQHSGRRGTWISKSLRPAWGT